MRELAKILIESQKLNPAIKNLYEQLHPQYFDLVVQCAKIIAKYNPETDVYESPTFGMNISRCLKDSCDIAILHVCKRTYKNVMMYLLQLQKLSTKYKNLTYVAKELLIKVNGEASLRTYSGWTRRARFQAIVDELIAKYEQARTKSVFERVAMPHVQDPVRVVNLRAIILENHEVFVA